MTSTTTSTSIQLTDGRVVEVRPFTFMEGLRLAPALNPLLKALDRVVGDGEDLADLAGVFLSHPDALREMLITGTSLQEADLDALSARDGEALALALWVANVDFFVRRLSLMRAIRQVAARPTEEEPVDG